LGTILNVDHHESNPQVLGELRATNQRLEALIGLGCQKGEGEDAATLLEKYCRGAREIIGAAWAAICITDEEGREVKRYCATGSQTGCLADAHSGAIDGRGETILSYRAPCRGQLQTDGPIPADAQPISYLVAPIMTPKRTYGWLGLANKIGNEEFTPEDECLAGTLAAQLGASYENAQVLEEVKLRAQSLEHEAGERRNDAEKYRMVLEQASDGIAIGDEQGNYLEVNAKLLEMLGYAREQFLKLNMRDLISDPDELGDSIPLDDLRAGKVVRKERRLLRHGGTFLEVETSVGRLEDGRIHAIVRDVTERRSLEQQLRQAQKLEAVGRLAGGIAHDFNNLLTVIIGHSHLALSLVDSSSRVRKDLENIQEAASRAAVLTGQLLAFSRKQVLQPRLVDVNDSIAKLMKMTGRLINSNIELVTRLAPKLAPVKVDPLQLDLVILNLALNASDAMPLGGKLIIETRNHILDAATDFSELSPGYYILINVNDTGCGMSAETKSHLFEPFFTTKPAGKGTGLGLSMVYGIVRQSGGHIWVTSELGEGTSYKILLPAAPNAVMPEDSVQENVGLAEGAETILLVEDEQRVRTLGSIILNQLGYTVLEAGNGDEAFRTSNEYHDEIHLLFTDIMMPGISGKDLADKIQRQRPNIRVLFSSGYTDDAVIHQGVLDPGTPFLQKPFTPRTLANKIREALDRDRGAVNSQDNVPQGRPTGRGNTDTGVEYTS